MKPYSRAPKRKQGRRYPKKYRGRRFGKVNLPQLVRRIVHRHVPAEARCLIALRDQWSQIAGERIAAKTLPMLVRKKTLFVEVASAQWRHELLYMQSMLLERINAQLQDYEISELQWKNANRSGFISSSQAQTLVQQRLLKKDPVAPPLKRPPPLNKTPPPETMGAIEDIRDPVLRRLAKNARIALGHSDSGS